MTEEDTHTAGPTSGDDTGVGPGREYPGIPRWVKVSGIIVIVVVLLVVATMIVGGGGEHGPGRHAASGDAGTPPVSVITEGHTPSTGAHTPL